MQVHIQIYHKAFFFTLLFLREERLLHITLMWSPRISVEIQIKFKIVEQVMFLEFWEIKCFHGLNLKFFVNHNEMNSNWIMLLITIKD